jgi:putative aldouronate transport system substrate-binding protein
MRIDTPGSRRRFIALAFGASALTALAVACGQAPVATPAPAPKPTDVPTAPAAAPTATTATVVQPSAPTAAAAPSAPSPAPQTAAAKPAAQTVLPPDVTPGSPSHNKGWTTILPTLGKGLPYNPVITITTSKRTDQATKFAKGDTLENNPFTRINKAALGIEWKVAWTWVQPDEALQKYNLAMASNQLPDWMETVPGPVYVKMLEANMLEDITDVYEAEADPELVKKPLQFGGGLAWSYSEVNGRKMGFPQVERAYQNEKLLWIRQDWLEKLGLTPPRTLDELAAVAKAFVKAQLGQGAPGTTVGLNVGKDIIVPTSGWYAGFDPVFGAFGVVPGFWTKEGNGLMLDTLRPQAKDALALLRQWYADGLLPNDYYTRAAFDAMKLVAGNQTGLYFAPSFGANLDSVTNDPKAKWMFVDIPAGPGGKKGKLWQNPFRESPFAVRKGATKAAEAIMRQTNWMVQLGEDPKFRFHGWEGYNYEWKGDEIASTNIGWAKWSCGPVGNAGGTGVDPLRDLKRFQTIEEWAKIPKDKRDAWQQFTLEDPTGIQDLQRKSYLLAAQVSEQEGIKNLFTTLPTKTMVSSQTTLQKLEEETYAGIITGQKPLSAFDDFVAQWKKLGGDQVIQEVNEWWGKKK